MDYYYADGDEQRGPVNAQELQGLGLAPETLVWREGLADWVRIDSLTELLNPSAGTVSPIPTASKTIQASAPIRTPQPIGPYGAAQTSPIVPGPYDRSGNAIAYHAVHSPGSRSNGMAVASLVLGIISFPLICVYLLGVITAILAIVFGLMARGKVRRQEAVDGAGIALAGVICGSCALGLMVVLIVIGIIVAVNS